MDIGNFCEDEGGGVTAAKLLWVGITAVACAIGSAVV